MKSFIYAVALMVLISTGFALAMGSGGEEEEAPASSNRARGSSSSRETLQTFQMYDVLKEAHRIATENVAEEVEEKVAPERDRIDQLERDLRQTREQIDGLVGRLTTAHEFIGVLQQRLEERAAQHGEFDTSLTGLRDRLDTFLVNPFVKQGNLEGLLRAKKVFLYDLNNSVFGDRVRKERDLDPGYGDPGFYCP